MPHLGGMIKPATLQFRKGTVPGQPPVGARLRENRESSQVVFRPLLKRGEGFQDLDSNGVGSGAVFGRMPAVLAGNSRFRFPCGIDPAMLR